MELDPQLREALLELARSWEKLARTYEFAEQVAVSTKKILRASK